MITWFWLAVGLAILTAGAEVLVRGAVGLATTRDGVTEATPWSRRS